MEYKDRTMSSIIILITLGLLLYAFSISDTAYSIEGRTLKDIFIYLINNYLDFILIVYVFICFQIAGYVELKYKQDFITTSFLSILFTPLSILFILQNEVEDDLNYLNIFFILQSHIWTRPYSL